MPDTIQQFADEHLAELKAGLDAMLRDRGTLDERIETRRRLIDSLEKESAWASTRLFEPPAAETNGSAAAKIIDTKPGAGDAVLRILTESDRPMTRNEIFKALDARGWAPKGQNPKAAVGSSLWYLNKKKQILRSSSGWALRTADGSDQPLLPEAASPGEARG